MTATRPTLSTLSNIQTCALVLLLGSVIALGVLAWMSQSALCALRGDLENRAAANQELLDTQRDPIIRAYGLHIPRSVIRTNLNSQRATLRSLNGLYC